MFPVAQTFICVGPNCWGAGSTPAEAKRNMLKHLGRRYRKEKISINFIATTAPREEVNIEDGVALFVSIPNSYAALKWEEEHAVRR